ncbi:hypothetical protein F5887DRAFT_83966 [Amanita rubescens]|nr:hypothetical protein F5887DRAFT_83966 [Amanita rubescens]
MEGKLVLKITDDTTVSTYAQNEECSPPSYYSASSSKHTFIFLNRFEALNLSLMQKMQNRRQKEKEARLDIPLKPELGRDSPLPRTMTPSAGPSAGSGGGVTKKKPKKKK